MPLFESASSVQINGGNFYDYQRTIFGMHHTHNSLQGVQILHRACAGDAFHDSAERYPQPRCHPDTRTEMLDILWNCLLTSEDNRGVLWLYGPAGAGKTAISQSFCEKLQEEGRLGGSFFFKRGHASRGNAKKLFPTIAYQLAGLLPELNRVISQIVEVDPASVDRSLSFQLQTLILDSYLEANTRPLVIVIDGLDECEDQNIQQEILRSIGNAARRQYLPLQFLVASRPEPHIREIFQGLCMDGIARPLSIRESFDDIETYLLHEFMRIHREHRETMAAVPMPWPSPDIIHQLVSKSSGYFIYTSTVIKFIDDRNFRPTDRLEIIMGLTVPDFGMPFAKLDQLYTQILSEVPARPQLLRILTIIAAKFDLTAPHIDQVLQLKTGDCRLSLRGLHSVIMIPEDDDRSNPPWVTVHHASFLDFLDDPARSGSFYVGDPQYRTDLAHHILKAFSYNYQDLALNRSGPVAW
ncbi:hypothetical protein DFH09DRAFT_911052 [Mycena vulgaris]|nr:hypothetical protein DFH09DRAFT_911052 [Mycena vulgaris]